MIEEQDFQEFLEDPRHLREFYIENGIVLIRNLFDQKTTDQPKEDVIRLFDNKAVVEDFDESYQNLWNKKKSTAHHSQTLARDLPSFLSLISNPKLIQVIRNLLQANSVICPFDWCIFRIDGPSTKISKFDWHQDYSYNVISTQAITFWIALSDVTTEMGLLNIVPKSNNEILKVKISNEQVLNNPNRITLDVTESTQEEWTKNAITAPPMKQGDVLLFNSLLVHSSGNNSTNKYRWVANGRYTSTSAKDFIDRDYHMARVKYPFYFENAHPELTSEF